uniref:Uncharacterized protein n=1 Tax=viral metagenome TaxID=1070528 RepID=A0A6C0JH69_9ZZZZ
MDANLQKFVAIMVFYIVLAFVIMPLMFYYLIEKSLLMAGHGFALGSAVSVMLWYTVGSTMIHK